LSAALLLSLGSPIVAEAGNRSYGNITVQIDTPPQDASQFGYVVYRVTVLNRGDRPRDVRVTMPGNTWGSDGDYVRSLSRTVRVEAGGSVIAELMQPALPMDGGGARVTIDGQPQEDQVPVRVVDHVEYWSDRGPPILASNDLSAEVRTAFESAMAELEAASASSGTWHGGPFGRHLARPAQLARAEYPVGEWSGNWLAYTRYTAVMLTRREAQTLRPAVAAALRDYVSAGGHLIVVGRDGLDALPTAIRRGWTSTEDDVLRLGFGTLRTLEASWLVGRTAEQWKDFIDTPNDSSPGTHQLLGAADAESRLPMLEELGVPVRGLLTLMIVFTLLIGPINVVGLSLLKRRMWLLWTVPLLSLMFAGAVLAYSIWTEGIEPRARSVAVTLLDQESRQAVSVGMVGVYAPLTLGDGLRFDGRTQIVPTRENIHGYYDGGGRGKSIDNTNGQHLTGGWVVARVPMHLGLRKVEPRRERLEISRNDDGSLTVVNGLGAAVERLLIADADGETFEVTELAAGGSAAARRTELSRSPEWFIQDAATGYLASDLQRDIRNGPDDWLIDGGYVALLDESPFLDPGIADLKQHDAQSVVLGRWRETD
jgi:hypothetical protein